MLGGVPAAWLGGWRFGLAPWLFVSLIACLAGVGSLWVVATRLLAPSTTRQIAPWMQSRPWLMPALMVVLLFCYPMVWLTMRDDPGQLLAQWYVVSSTEVIGVFFLWARRRYPPRSA